MTMGGGQVVLVAYDAAGMPHRVLVDANGYLIPAQENPPGTFGHGSQTTNAGVAVALVPAGLAVREVMITAMEDNLDYVYIGGPTVSSVNYGKRLLAGAWVGISIDNLSKIFMDVDTDGEGVNFLYVV